MRRRALILPLVVVAPLALGPSTAAAAPATSAAAKTSTVKRSVAAPGSYQVSLRLRGRARSERVDVFVGRVVRRGITVGRRKSRTVRLRVDVPGRVVRARVVGRRTRPVVAMFVRQARKKKSATTTPPPTTTAPTPTAPAPSPTASIGSVAPQPAPSTLVWSDEFVGPAGGPVASTNWMHEVGGHGWGNNELQTFTDRTANSATDGQGALALTARRERFTGTDGHTREFTSARLITKGRFTPTYGRIEARIKPPAGKGLWPLFWMMGDDVWNVGWPESGEVDVMEMIGQSPNENHGTMHGPTTTGGHFKVGNTFTAPGPLTSDYHVFGLRWWSSGMEWDVDGTVFHRVLKSELPAGARWVYDKPFHLILSMSVGGTWPGAPDATTPFPATMAVDWVRVYQ
ncbi:MAG TPA: glycoside hydrolase family 16 protein [Baekduia sp.]|nr:glycoside hydrolase family 16 protein [Baekduia sp.]